MNSNPRLFSNGGLCSILHGINQSHQRTVHVLSLKKENRLVQVVVCSSAPNEVRTRVSALRGPRPGPLDNGGGERRNFTISHRLRQL
jgi:hypothetical protein